MDLEELANTITDRGTNEKLMNDIWFCLNIK